MEFDLSRGFQLATINLKEVHSLKEERTFVHMYI